MGRSLQELTVIVVTRNSRGTLERFFDEIDELDPQILVVDNASGDGTSSVARGRGAECLKHSQNRGFASAANSGALETTTPYLCFMNPDCRPESGLFRLGVATLAKQERVIAAPSLDEGQLGVTPGRRQGYTRWRLLGDTIVSNYGTRGLMRSWSKSELGSDPSWYWAHGACFFVRRDLFLDLGGFDQNFFLYMEDVDLGKRLYRRGGKVVDLRTVVTHRSGSSTDVRNSIRLAYLNRGRAEYAAKYYGKAWGRFLWILGYSGVLPRRWIGR